MKANIRMHDPSVLHRAQLLKSIQVRQSQPMHEDEAVIEVLAYLVVCGIAWTAVLLAWWLL